MTRCPEELIGRKLRHSLNGAQQNGGEVVHCLSEVRQGESFPHAGASFPDFRQGTPRTVRAGERRHAGIERLPASEFTHIVAHGTGRASNLVRPVDLGVRRSAFRSAQPHELLHAPLDDVESLVPEVGASEVESEAGSDGRPLPVGSRWR